MIKFLTNNQFTLFDVISIIGATQICDKYHMGWFMIFVVYGIASLIAAIISVILESVARG